MDKRVTIMITKELDSKVRRKQAQLIQKTNSSVSFSRVINDVLAGKYKL